MNPETAVLDAQRQFDAAELHADLDALRRLIADDFASIGPKGFVLDKEQWIGRHVHFRYHAIETSEVSVRCYDRAAIVRNLQRNRASYAEETMELTVRVSQVWVQKDDRWLLAGIQFSPVAQE